MSKRVVVDPITRIEGHLRIEAQMDGDKIAQAYSAGTMVRGIELILKGRDPRDAWAFTQRICGVCTLVHGIAAVRSVENALNYPIPANAQLIRNLMIMAQYVHDHVMHFYHLHALDWVDVVSALDADPKATSELAQSISKWPKSSPGYFADMKKKLKTFVEGGQLGIFSNAYWGHPAYKLPPEANLMAVSHYLEALTWQRDVVKLHTIFGGKNPHPNFLVGGVASAIDLNSDSAINIKKLSQIQNVINEMQTFVDQVYVPDTLAIASFYKDWGTRGEGLGNFLCYGDLPGTTMADPDNFFLPSGIILNRDISTVHPLDLNNSEEIQEYVSHSWYDYSAGKDSGLHPYDGETELNYSGPKPPYEQLDVDKSYSWLKSPRWKGLSMEVGPLARVLMLYAKGHEQTRELVAMTLNKLDLPVEALFSTLGRTAARTLETKIIVDGMQGMFDQLMSNIKSGDTKTFNDQLWEPSTWPKKAQGVGFMEAPRGALGHWIVIEDEKIANYQAVVPSTWNAGPRDPQGQPRAYEAALQDNHQLHDAKQPIEILRTIHSFDPCIACAVHVTDPDGEELVKVKVT
ncbi:MAG: nickel-dependent hydrogenase large subunit [gamma proteobacterium symbiont of Bathyaustriella thionipta]|nr:nickel-dependent hydrogenase large subunit [gamma proteobacterium symbiont of Bathyaustriella thionipta]MCU7949801.1 nickel-dependent hydrogenase large subunit [gamma proteobacterium symbiont of Bathyaustriella thionipta]MCU7951830.1 nickel-dependent hydrogenase large subunit [gamma proteobacterium symbiont of Bathyaustriella thionipta]MCU7956400.1 nickel-dependent hydrogenase large subunit [gamma proteobacterium symbiont of Bathyaustriella thionipta]